MPEIRAALASGREADMRDAVVRFAKLAEAPAIEG
jgi:hypothetical protein